MLSECTLHFGFDDSSLTAADQTILRKVADTLQKRSWIAIRIAGHADERGTEEYNMALGMKRADAARNYLIALGVSEEQVDSVSFGEEKPLVSESGEEGWAYNRRDEIGIMPLELYGLLSRGPARPIEVLK
jgi:peptidoglycan-associated lipoprotein